MIDPVTIVKFPATWNMHREPMRPINRRIDYCGGMKFDENFDWDTIWYDCIKLNNRYTALIGPPIYNEIQWFTKNVGFADEHGNNLKYGFIDLDRVSICIIETAHQHNKLIMTSTAADPVDIQRNIDDGYFQDHKVIVTLQRDNPISWIEQWVDYHYQNHGIDGFLIYDNASKDYTVEELDARLSKPHLKIKIVPWPYPYGPQGSDNAPWDSDYGQYCMLEHAKHRYLSTAQIVINNDIDELIVTNGTNFAEISEQLKTVGCMLYQGVWIEPYDIVNQKSAHETQFEQRQFANYHCTDDTNTRGIGFKWLLNPQMNLQNQWLVHRIAGPSQNNKKLWYAHHLSMNTNWSWQRDHFTGDVNNLKPNQDLEQAQSMIKV